MFRYALKKAFFDLWDHLFFALGVNLIFTLAVLGLSSLSVVFQGLGLGVQMIYLLVPALMAALLGGIMTFWAKDLAVQGSARLSDVWTHFKASWRPSLVFGGAWLVIGAGYIFGVPFYFKINEILGFGFGIVMVWLAFFAAGMGLFYPGLNAQVEPKVTKLVRKSVMLFIANPWASLVMALGVAVSLVLSTFTLGFFPGLLGLSVWLQVCFKFILAKYEWMEANPEADHKKVPWAVLVAEDMEKVGPRSLRSMIFPWKD